MLAASLGHIEVVDLLLKRDANVQVQDTNGSTALTLARKHNHTDVVQLLKKFGAK
jgi:ankyrin repeat protein